MITFFFGSKQTERDMIEEAIQQIGEAGLNLYKAINYIIKWKINWQDVAEQIVKNGIGSSFIASITAIFIGFAMSVQLAKQLLTLNAETYVGALVSTAAIRELAPVISAIVVAARVGSAISAEIGSMKSSEQVDALIVLGIDPVKYLIVPRLLASAIITPLLTVLSAALIIIAGMLLVNYVIHLSFEVYLSGVRIFNSTQDVFVMLLKAFTFGISISIIATTSGLQVEGGAEAVGDSTTKTVVWSIIFIFIFNYIITSIFYRI